MSPRTALWVVLWLAACAREEPGGRARRPTPDKSALFGDPTLVPTREGEHVRRELARAGEIEAAISLLPDVLAAHVTVELGANEDRVVVSLRTASVAAEERLRPDIAAIVDGIAGTERPHALVLVADAPADGAARVAPVPLALALALVGLGASGGIALDRLVRLRRRQRRRVA